MSDIDQLCLTCVGRVHCLRLTWYQHRWLHSIITYSYECQRVSGGVSIRCHVYISVSQCLVFRVCVLIYSLRLSVKFNLKENVSHTFHTHAHTKINNFYFSNTESKRKKQCTKPETKTTVQLRAIRALRRWKSPLRWTFSFKQACDLHTFWSWTIQQDRSTHTLLFLQLKIQHKPISIHPKGYSIQLEKSNFGGEIWKWKLWVSEWVSERVLTGDGEEEPFSCKIRECPINSWLPLLRWRMRNCRNGFERDGFRVFKFQMFWSQNPII